MQNSQVEKDISAKSKGSNRKHRRTQSTSGYELNEWSKTPSEVPERKTNSRGNSICLIQGEDELSFEITALALQRCNEQGEATNIIVEELELPKPPNNNRRISHLPGFILNNYQGSLLRPPSSLDSQLRQRQTDKQNYLAQLNMSAINERISEENVVSVSGKKRSKADVSYSNNISSMASHNMSCIKQMISIDSRDSPTFKPVGLSFRPKGSVEIIDVQVEEMVTPSSVKGAFEASTKINETPDFQSNRSQASKTIIQTDSISPPNKVQTVSQKETTKSKLSSLASSLKNTPKLVNSNIILKSTETKQKNQEVLTSKRMNLEVESSISNFKLGGPITWQLIFDKKKDNHPAVLVASGTASTSSTQPQVVSANCTQHNLQPIPMLKLSRRSTDKDKKSSLGPHQGESSTTNKNTSKPPARKKAAGHRRTLSDTQHVGLHANSTILGIASTRPKQPSFALRGSGNKHERERVFDHYGHSQLHFNSLGQSGQMYPGSHRPSHKPAEKERASEKNSERPRKLEYSSNFSKKAFTSIARAQENQKESKKSSLTQELVKELKRENILKKKENLQLKEENQCLKKENMAFRIMLDQNPALIDKCFPLIDVIHKNMGPLKTSLDSQVLQDAPDLLENCSHIIKKESPGRGHVKAVSLSESTPNQGKLTSCGKNKKSSQDLRGPLTRKTESNQSAKDVRSSLTKLTENSLSAKDVRKIKK